MSDRIMSINKNIREAVRMARTTKPKTNHEFNTAYLVAMNLLCHIDGLRILTTTDKKMITKIYGDRL